MADFKLIDNDINLTTNGQINFIRTGKEETQQRAEIIIRKFRGENIFNTNEGINYEEYLGIKTDFTIVADDIRTNLLQDNEISDVLIDITSVQQRILDLQIIITTPYGEINVNNR